MAKLLQPALAGNAQWEALDSANARLESLDLSPLLVYLVDIVTPDALPHLATQFHVMGNEGWAFADTVDKKRALIKNAFELHRFKGTPWAIENAIKTLGYAARVIEWFEADFGTPAQPYWFKVDVTLDGIGISSSDFDKLNALIAEYKNVRSWIQQLRLKLQVQSKTPSLAGYTFCGEVGTVYPYQLTQVVQNSKLYIGAAGYSVEVGTVYPRIN